MVDFEILEDLPSFVSFRKSALKTEGGDLNNLYDVPRWDGSFQSREAAHTCRKDWRCSSSHTDIRRARRQIRTLLGKD